jgi:leader peptidase (prepilin peptidase)/N-methyltransferase
VEVMLSNLRLHSTKHLIIAFCLWSVLSAVTIADKEGTEILSGIILALLLVWASFIDFKKKLLPNLLTVPLICLGVFQSLIGGVESTLQSILGAIVGYGSIWCIHAVYLKRTGRNGIGLGDAKLFSASGAWLGWVGLPYVMLIASFSGIVAYFARILFKPDYDNRNSIAFGPFISVGFWIVWYFDINPYHGL